MIILAKYKGAIIGTILLAAGALAGFELAHLQAAKDLSDRRIIPIRAKEEGYALINPLLGFEVSEELGSKEYASLREDLTRLIADRKEAGDLTSASVYVRRLNSGWWMAVNEDERFSPASMFKMIIMIAYFKRAESDSTILPRKIYYDGTFDKNELLNFKPSVVLKKKQWYTVEELIRRMILYSDNSANYLLLSNNILRNEDLTRLFTDLGLTPPDLYNDLDSMSAETYSNFYRVLYNATYLSNSYSEKALDILSKTDFKGGLVAPLPSSLTVAHKFGERSITAADSSIVRELHDCGAVYYSTHPYFVCVMTKGKDFNKLSEVIQEVSGRVYTYFTGRFPLQP